VLGGISAQGRKNINLNKDVVLINFSTSNPVLTEAAKSCIGRFLQDLGKTEIPYFMLIKTGF